jgi:hypothetical protein
MLDGFWVLANRRVWDKISADLRDILERNIDEEALRQRTEVECIERRSAVEGSSDRSSSRRQASSARPVLPSGAVRLQPASTSALHASHKHRPD